MITKVQLFALLSASNGPLLLLKKTPHNCFTQNGKHFHPNTVYALADRYLLEFDCQIIGYRITEEGREMLAGLVHKAAACRSRRFLTEIV